MIVPVYNVEPYLRKSLDSLLAQTCERLEIILVDDGSTDASGQICDEYAARDARFQVVHQENGGVAEARNAGLRHIHGEYAGFVDADGWADPELFQELYAAAEQKCEISVCGVTLAYGDERGRTYVYGPRRILEHREALKLLLEDADCLSRMWNKLFERKIVEDLVPP